MRTNDEADDKAREAKEAVAQMNADAVVQKLQDFEARLGQQDVVIDSLKSQVQALEKRMSIQMNLEAMTSKMGSGPTAT